MKPEITAAEVQSILWERSPDLDDLQEMPPTIMKSVQLRLRRDFGELSRAAHRSSVKSMAKRGGDSILWVSIEP